MGTIMAATMEPESPWEVESCDEGGTLELVVIEAGSGPVLGIGVAGSEGGLGSRLPATAAPVDGVSSGVSISSAVLVMLEVDDEVGSNLLEVDQWCTVK